jgi:spore photoproduct lyase
LKAVTLFQDAGYDVHLNFSPVIVQTGWLDEYKILFEEVNKYVKNKDKVKCEVIFLTHNENKHQNNLQINSLGEELLWKPNIQESKISQYGGKNIRYNHKLKAQYIKEWTELHNKIINWCTIRYIF